MDKIEVCWNDTFANTGWWTMESLVKEIDELPYLNTTTGYKVFENDIWLVVAMSHCSKQNVYGHVKYIPKGCIVSVTVT